MKRLTKRLLSLLLSVMMLATMLPISAFAVGQGNDQQDSGSPPHTSKHWLQKYQEAMLAQLSSGSSEMKKTRAASNKPSLTMIYWAS